MKNFINISDLSKNELRSIIDGAKKRKLERGKKPNSEPDIDQPIKGKTMIMLFAKPSTRTRISFDLAVKQLGGSSIILNHDEIHYGKGDETIKDTAKVLSQYSDILMIRTNSHKNIDEFKKYLDIPIINGLTDKGHPCQVMSDILTFEELKGDIKGKTISWIGDGNNVLGSDSGNPIRGIRRTMPSKTRAWQVPFAIIRNNTMGLVYDIPQNCPVLLAISCSFIHRKHVLPTLRG